MPFDPEKPNEAEQPLLQDAPALQELRVGEYPQVVERRQLVASFRELCTPIQVEIPEEIIEYTKKHPLEALTFNDKCDLIDIKKLEAAVEITQVYRNFYRSLKASGRDFILYTGSTADLVKDMMVTVAHEESGGTDKNVPESVSWPTHHYFPLNEAGPNAVVYKELDEYMIHKAVQNARNAMEVAELRQKNLDQYASQPAEIRRTSIIQKTREQLAKQQGTKITELPFEEAYNLVVGIRSLDQAEINEALSVFNEEQIGHIRAQMNYINGVVDIAEQIEANFSGELARLQYETEEIERSMKSGRYIQRTRSNLFGGTEQTVLVEQGDKRVALMKVLYPEAILNMYAHYPDKPKHISLYDNLIDTGEKIRGYEHFFGALGIEDDVKYYAVFSNPNFVPSWTLSSKLSIGIRQRFYEDPDDVKFLGRAHDNLMSFSGVITRHEGLPDNPESLQAYLAYKYRALTEIALLPEALPLVKSEYAEWIRQANGDSATLARLAVHNIDTVRYPQSLIPAHDVLGKLSPNAFEVALRVDKQEKEFYSIIRNYFDGIAQGIAENPDEYLYVDDRATYVAIMALLETGKYPTISPNKIKFSYFVSDIKKQIPTSGNKPKVHYLADRWPTLLGTEKLDDDYELDIACMYDERKKLTTAERATEYASNHRRIELYLDDLGKIDSNVEILINPDQAQRQQILENFSDFATYCEGNIEELVQTLGHLSSLKDFNENFDLQSYIAMLKNSIYRKAFTDILSREETALFFGYISTVGTAIQQKVRNAQHVLHWQPDFATQPIEALREEYQTEQLPKYLQVVEDLHQLEKLDDFHFIRVFSKCNLSNAEYLVRDLERTHFDQQPTIEGDYDPKYVTSVSRTLSDHKIYYFVSSFPSDMRRTTLQQTVEFMRDIEKAKYLAEV